MPLHRQRQVSTCLFLAAVLLVSFVLGGFEGLQAAAHVSLEHLPVLPLLIARCHEVPTVVRLVLQDERDGQKGLQLAPNTGFKYIQQDETGFSLIRRKRHLFCKDLDAYQS